MTFSPQSQDIYKILLRSDRPLSARILANQMRIPPSLAYRLTKPLIEMGLIAKINAYPCLFRAKLIDEGLSLFLLAQNEWFSKQFLASGENLNATSKEPNEIRLSFIQSRDELMNKSTEETARTAKTVDLLRSGGEVPPDVMLAINEARKRNVRIRMLIQDYSSENAARIEYWKQNGIIVRKTELRHIRLMLYDSSVLYFMSYRHTDSGKDLGMKINYPPLAVIFSKLFDEWWQKAERA
jgi:sugar-specific transcriptional regulator TrmB